MKFPFFTKRPFVTIFFVDHPRFLHRSPPLVVAVRRSPSSLAPVLKGRPRRRKRCRWGPAVENIMMIVFAQNGQAGYEHTLMQKNANHGPTYVSLYKSMLVRHIWILDGKTPIMLVIIIVLVVPARGGAEVALGLYYKAFLIYRTCMRRASARPVRACLLSKNTTCARPRCNATPSTALRSKA